MSNTTKIEWADSTFNPWIGCTNVSPACDNCYAEVSTPSRTLRVEWGTGKLRHRTSPSNWKLPMRWNAEPFYTCGCGYRGTMHDMTTNAVHGCRLQFRRVRRRVFCASLADVFDNEVDPKWRADLFALIEATPNLDWLLLTKRIGNVAKMAPVSWLGGPVQHGPNPTNIHGGWPAHVWLGATICNQVEAERDVPKLLSVPAAVRFLSAEPMLGPIDLRWLITEPTGNTRTHHGKRQMELRSTGLLHWVITGGESGSDARPSNPQWFRGFRDLCAAAGVAYLHKQNGEWVSVSEVEGTGKHHTFSDARTVRQVGRLVAGRMLDGKTHNEFPELSACPAP